MYVEGLELESPLYVSRYSLQGIGRNSFIFTQLLLALFRILEPASGTIYIDGVDITKIGLHDRTFPLSRVNILVELCLMFCSIVVRSSISIVPQSPDLFEGTIRENIDPVGEHADADIWVALGQVHISPSLYLELTDQGLVCAGASERVCGEPAWRP